jgi:RecA-family ATPase
MQLAGWQILDAATTQRKGLLLAGYLPLPTEGKKPPIAGWQNLVPDEGEIDSWFHQYPAAFNTGVLTRTTPAVDIDVYDPDVAQAIEAMLWDMMGIRGMVRFGEAPKRAALFRTETPFGKISTPVFTSPTGQRHRVEVLCNGQQIVVLGTHPGTGEPYSWHGGEPGDVARADLPELTEAVARELVAKAATIMRTQGWTEDVARKTNGDGAYHGGGNADEFDSIYGSRERKYALATLLGCADELAAMAPDSGRNNKLNALAFRLGTMSARGWISRGEVVDRLFAAAVACRLVADDGDAATRATLESGLGNGECTPHPDLTAETLSSQQADNADEPLPFLDMSQWDAEPAPPRLWSVRDRIPLRQPALFSGEGAIGKTLLALQLSAAHVLGRDWLGMLPELGPAIYFGAEDEADEIRRRMGDIAAHYSATFADLIDGGLHLLSFAGKNALLGMANRAGIIEPTPLYHRIHKAVCSIKPQTLVIDTSADVFAGNENDRMQVRQFVGLLRRLAIEGNCSVLLCSHPSLTGISTGSGLSGSTGWHNSVRARMVFRTATTDQGEEPDPELRELVFMKNNYGPIGTRVLLRWKNGVFVPEPREGTLEKAAAERRAEELFLTLLNRFTGQGRNVSDKIGPSYAPALFAGEVEAKAARIGKTPLVAAMARLFSSGKIHMEPYGYPSRGTFRIAAGQKP